jgi:diguanylate cyclase (GGDEF)-like protein/putative nucleotidyltransferase with HDIG domain
MPLHREAKAFISVLAVAAASSFTVGAIQWHQESVVHFLCYLAVTTVASTLKITLPGVDGTMSVNFLFILWAVKGMSLGEALLLGVAAVAVQSFWKASKRIQPVQFIFNLSQLTVAITGAYGVYHAGVNTVFRGADPLALMAAAITYFLLNTAAMSIVISFTEERKAMAVWRECYFWSFPYYLVGAAIAAAVGQFSNRMGWQTAIVAMPAVYAIYRSYHLYLSKLQTEKKLVEQIAGLHLRTIEALALAIEAKDHNTHEHLERVRTYAMALADDLCVGHEEKEALRAAALLHDIGKLAIPEHIISKPGKLTPEEFEKMKIHPIVGAEILKEVDFPYPVVPIVRSHHEKWDGSGYPDGLRGNEIPIGARILATVDCLDALASDRQYRRALPLDEAMACVASEAGKAFDPEVVKALQGRYIELERMAVECAPQGRTRLSTAIKVKRGDAPAAGFQSSGEEATDRFSARRRFLSSIAAARHEGYMLFELTHELGNSLSLKDTVSVVSTRLKQLVPYDSIALYLVQDELLHAEFAKGKNEDLLSSLEIPFGQGLSGWVAQNGKPILNGNPSVEPGYLNDPTKFSSLRSGLAVPLEGASGVLGVLALYASECDAFTSDHLRIVQAISSKLGLVIENSLKYRVAEASANTDALTGLLNSRALFNQLEKELGRCRREGTSLAVFLCDLDQFKSINDQFGHIEGNKLLMAFAELLKHACREYDCVARMGGDEFVVIAPAASVELVLDMAERIAAVGMQAGQHVNNALKLSVSVGTAFYPADGQRAEQLLSEADRRMYRRKHERDKDAKGPLYPPGATRLSMPTILA